MDGLEQCHLPKDDIDYFESMYFQYAYKSTDLKWFINRQLLWINYIHDDGMEIIQFVKNYAVYKKIPTIAINVNTDDHSEIARYEKYGFCKTFPDCQNMSFKVDLN